LPDRLKPLHAPRKTEKAREFDLYRGTSASRGYDRKWTKVRNAYIADHPLCEVCSRPDFPVLAELVHHIVPVDQAPDRLLDETNLQAVCRDCHARIHGRDHHQKPGPGSRAVRAPTGSAAAIADDLYQPVGIKLRKFTDPHIQDMHVYALDVLSGKVDACKFVKQAVARFLADLSKAGTPGFPYRFDHEKASRICRFAEQIRNVKGPLAGQLIRLQPWQRFFLGNVFGWVHADGPRKECRRFRKVYLEVPRGAGKSTLLSIIGIYMLACQPDGGAEVYSAAKDRDQARIILDDAKLFCRQNAELTKALGITVQANAIIVERTNSRFRAISRDAKSTEGKAPSFAAVDELHVHPDGRVYSVLDQGGSKRPESLIIAITTAGDDISSFCYEERDYLIKTLDGMTGDETLFGIVYTIDDEDDWTLESSWRKAHPNFGITVDASYIAGLARKAMISPIAQADFKTKQLDVWVNSSSGWMNMLSWAKVGKELNIDDFVGEPCFVGIDFATQSDITAKALIFRRREQDGEDHYYVFCTHYLPETALAENVSYQKWVQAKPNFLKITPGNATYIGQIKEDLLADLEKFRVQKVAIESYQSAYFTQELSDRIEFVTIRNVFSELSTPMKFVESLVYDARLHHDKRDQCFDWQISNVVPKRDYKDNICPSKEFDRNKIDAPSAMIFAMALAIPEEESEYIYSDGREIMFVPY
jgi:phage terminase large subunit-like protein/5-methylcytosine-specific restriction endonuclease McrA